MVQRSDLLHPEKEIKEKKREMKKHHWWYLKRMRKEPLLAARRRDSASMRDMSPKNHLPRWYFDKQTISEVRYRRCVCGKQLCGDKERGVVVRYPLEATLVMLARKAVACGSSGPNHCRALPQASSITDSSPAASPGRNKSIRL